MGNSLFTITENGIAHDVGDVDDFPDPSAVTIDQLLKSCQKHPTQGWRYYKTEDGTLACDMEWLGIESDRRPQHLRRRPATIEIVGGTAVSTLGLATKKESPAEVGGAQVSLHRETS